LAAAIEQNVWASEELEQLFRLHHARALKAAYRVTGSMSDAEDVTQTIFLRMARSASRPAAEEAGSYVYRAAVNAALDLLRQRRRVQVVPLEDAPELRASESADGSKDAELRKWLRLALAELSPRASEMFVLRYIEDYDNHEIARMLNTSRAAVGVVLFRTRARLRRKFREQMRGTK
jgi:RNA polymerase sigma-70 factor, ECF subfamily